MEKPPRSRRRGLLGFYIGAGVFIALALVAALTWKPLAIGCYERQIERKTPKSKKGPEGWPGTGQFVLWERAIGLQVDLATSHQGPPESEAAVRLADFGPAAGPAFRRLLRSENGNVRDLATIALTARRATWALPMLVELAGDEEEAVAWQAIITAGLLTEQGFVPMLMGTFAGGPSLAESRRNFLDWWEAEGRAKYGGGK